MIAQQPPTGPPRTLILRLPASLPTVTAISITDALTGVTRYQVTIDRYRVQITYTPPDPRHAPCRRHGYQIRVDQEHVHFAHDDRRPIEPQLARAIAAAITDLQRAQRRADLISGRRFDWWRP